MTTFERRQRLLNLLKDRPGIGVDQLADFLEVSQGTIRNDLNDLAASGMIMRVRGGAVLLDGQGGHSPSFSERAKANVNAKRSIARKAAEAIQNGDALLFDASSTVYYLAKELTGHRGLTILTNGVEVAIELAKNTYNTVILVGGVLRPDGTSITTLLSERIFENLHIKKAFVSCSGFSIENGMTEVDLQEAILKKKMIETVDAVYALIDASKFGKVDLTSFAGVERITQLYTESRLSEDWINRLLLAGIHFTLCEDER